jgi:hypothetical protein
MAQAVIGALRVNLGMNTAAFSRGADTAEQRLAKFGRNVTRVAAAYTAAVGVALLALTRNSLQTIDAQSKLAQQIGSSVASIQTLQYAGDLAGISMDQMATSLSRMNQRLGQVITRGSGPAARSLDILGIAAEDLIDLDADERIIVIADALSGLGSQAEVAAVAYDLFGRAGRDMVPFLQAGGDAIRSAREELERFGVVVTDAEARQIEAANDAVTRLQLAFTGLGNTLAVNVAPKLESAAIAIGDFLADNEDLIDTVIRLTGVLGAGLAGLMAGRLLSAVIGAAGAIGGLVTALRAGSVAALTFQRALGPIGLVLSAVAAAVLLLGGRQEGAASSSDVHREALIALRGEIDEAIAQGPSAVATLAAQKEGHLQVAEAALASALAQHQATNAALAGVMANDDLDAVNEMRRPENNPAIQALVEQIRLLRELQTVAAAPVGGGAPGETPPLIADPDQIARELEALQAGWRAANEVALDAYAERNRIIADGLATGQITADEANELFNRSQRDYDKALAEIAAEGRNKLLEDEVEGYGASEDAFQDHADEMARIADALAEQIRATQTRAISAWAGVMDQLADHIRDKGEKAFKIAKALSIASAIINTAQGITKALAEGTGPWRWVEAAAIAAAGALQVRQIRQTQPGGGAGSVSAPSAPAGGGGLNQTLTVQGATADQIFNGMDARALAEKLLAYQRDGGRIVFA